MTVEDSAQTPAERAFYAISGIELPRVFTGYGPLPAVVGTRLQTIEWGRVGARRLVDLSDGSSVPEELTVWEPPRRFAYRVGPFTGALGRLVRHADGEWSFVQAGDRTAISWTYAFAPRTPAAGVLVRLLLAPLWRRYAGRALALCVREVETVATR